MPCIITMSGRGSVHSSEENQTGRKLQREGSDTKHTHARTHTHTPSLTQTVARTHTQSVEHTRARWHTFLVSVILWLPLPGVALSAWAFHTSSLPDCEQHWSDGQREGERERERERETERERERGGGRESEREGGRESEKERESERERERESAIRQIVGQRQPSKEW